MKGGERLAQRIVDDIAARSWPIGEVLGTEPELLAAYGVSRGTFREAVRILEHLGCARMREGRGGGLAVTEPQPGPVTQAAAIYLRYRGVDTGSLHAARATIEIDLVARATVAMDDEGRERLEAALAEEADDPSIELEQRVSPVHAAIADIAGNEALGLFMRSLISLSDEYARPRIDASSEDLADARDESHAAHGAIVAAMVAGDRETAVRRMSTHLEAVERWMTAGRPAPTVGA